MVRGIRDAVGDRLELRIDPNTGYSPEVCEQLAKDLEPYRLQYFEQPMPEDLIDDSARIRKRTTHAAGPERVGHDHWQRCARSWRRRRRTSSCPTPISAAGSGRRSWWPRSRPRRTCRASSTAPTTSGPKTAAMLHLAASTPNFPLANDCTYYGLVDDVLTRPFEIQRRPAARAGGAGPRDRGRPGEGAKVPGRSVELRI